MNTTNLLGLTNSEKTDIQAYFNLLNNTIKPIVKKLDLKLGNLYKELGKTNDRKLENELCEKIDIFKLECQSLGFHSSLNAHNIHVSL